MRIPRPLVTLCALISLLAPTGSSADQVLPNAIPEVISSKNNTHTSALPDHDAAHLPDTAGLSLDQLHQWALANNPTLVQAAAQIRAARGAAYQAGLFLNPVIGYVGDQIGIEGTAGEMQGGSISQEFVTGGKLRLSRAKYCQRVKIAETNHFVQQQRILNDVAIGFYQTMAVQRQVEIMGALLRNGEDSVLTHQELVNLGQATHADLLQAEVDQQRDRLALRDARLDADRAWRDLTATLAMPELARTALVGTLEPVEPPIDWETAASQLVHGSPELMAAWQHVRHDKIAIERERVQPIPNIQVDVSAGRNFETSDTVAGVYAGLEVPIFDRNQGTIRQARADLTHSRANAQRLELQLRVQLAQHFQQYQAAWNHVQDYKTIMIPKAKQAHELLLKNYKARRIAWPEVLVAERTYLTLQREYVQRLADYRAADVVVRGMLLTGGLTQPAGAISGGHIDAVPKPR